MEIDQLGDKYALPNELQQLKYASRMAAKVDSAALQDGYQIYHHSFVFTTDGSWTVIQQGMNKSNRFARRYHWLSEQIDSYVCEPHSAICGDQKAPALNLVARESEAVRAALTKVIREKPETLIKQLKRIEEIQKKRRCCQLSFDFSEAGSNELVSEAALDILTDLECANVKTLTLPSYHPVPNATRMNNILTAVYERQPEDFETLLAMPGVGERAMRALTMVAEVIHGVKASHRDPVRFSFAHGGKDGFPYPVNQETYASSIRSLENALEKAKLGDLTKLKAMKKLATFADRTLIQHNTNEALVDIDYDPR